LETQDLILLLLLAGDLQANIIAIAVHVNNRFTHDYV